MSLETVYRFADRTKPETLQPNLSRASRLAQVMVSFSMRFRGYREWRAHRHMRGDTHNSPFVSVLREPIRLTTSTDWWARTIATGSPGLSGVQRAPDLAEFRVPSSKLIPPRADNTLSRQETELVFWGDDLINYLVRWEQNPY